MHVVVCVATYLRPEGLAKLLVSLEQQQSQHAFEVCVVDNDPEGSAISVVQSFTGSTRVTYHCEEHPGIASARNRAVSESLRADALAFVDDDEVVCVGWLEQLCCTAKTYRAQIVAGPVKSELPADASRLVKYLDLFATAEGVSGKEVRWPATNNVLVMSAVFEQLEQPYFSEDFSQTGGSDAEFFWRARQAGVGAVWASHALVKESVPSSRANIKWWWIRMQRLGNVSARLHARTKPLALVYAISFARIAFGATAGTMAIILAGPRGTRLFVHLPKGIGTYKALRGNLITEYARPHR